MKVKLASSGVFITATDTGVGKTLVTAVITRELRKKRISAVPAKVVQTGCEPESPNTPGWCASPDLDFCLGVLDVDGRITGLYHRMCPYCFTHPCSPHLAARLAGRKIDPALIISSLETLVSEGHFVVAEGTGGLMVPLTDHYTILDLISALRWPVILVARAGLGTLNHTLLSLGALRQRQVRVAGVIFDEADAQTSPPYIVKDNLSTIANWGDVPIIGYVPYLGKKGAAELVKEARAHIDWNQLLARLAE